MNLQAGMKPLKTQMNEEFKKENAAISLLSEIV